MASASDFELMRNAHERLKTFTTLWPAHLEQRPEELAEAGFFSLNDGDRVQCAFCRGVLKNWQPHQKPLADHQKYFERCPFIFGYDVGNVPLITDPIRTPAAESLSTDVCGNYIVLPFSPLVGDFNHSSRDNFSAKAAIKRLPQQTVIFPKNSGMVTFAARQATYKSKFWPENCPVSAYDLSTCGLFYLG